MKRAARPPAGPEAWVLAAQALERIQAGSTADQALSEAAQALQGKRLGSHDRAALGDCVYQALRHRRYAQALGGEASLTPRQEVLLQVMHASWPDAQPRRFRAQWRERVLGQLSAAEHAWLAACEHRANQLSNLPEAIRWSVPDWLMTQVQHDHPDLEAGFWPALLEQAPVDLRVNVQWGRRAAAQAALGELGIATEPTPFSPWGLRLQQRAALASSALFQQGAVDIQDEASQLLAGLAGVKRGQVVVDFCAGAGGKTLAMGALMRNSGQIFAMDISASRLQAMAPRVSRAGLTNVSTWVLQSEHDERLKRLRGKADVVLVDAPCSGLGTLRRSPELKWRVTPEALQAMAELQSRILNSAAELVKPGGRLVYATCSFMREEDEGVALAFDASHSGFEPVAAQPVLDALVGHADHGLCDATGRWMRAWPHRHQTDGFFASIWRAR